MTNQPEPPVGIEAEVGVFEAMSTARAMRWLRADPVPWLVSQIGREIVALRTTNRARPSAMTIVSL
jgi:hypothetical protein